METPTNPVRFIERFAAPLGANRPRTDFEFRANRADRFGKEDEGECIVKAVNATGSEDPSEALTDKATRNRPTKAERERVRAARKETPARPGMPGSVNDSRRCTATANRTGERCKAPAIVGGSTCRVHGGAAPQVKRAARDRLLDLIDPAIGQLSKLLNREDVDDGVRLRAITSLLDRVGYGPGSSITVTDTRFEDMLTELVQGGTVALDRSLANVGPQELPGGGTPSWEDYDQHSTDLTRENFRDQEAEDAEAVERGRIRPDERTVRGEVVEPEPHPSGP
jgi:hypothetical protein